jgi:dolichol-phosphate mannosyltransferase
MAATASFAVVIPMYNEQAGAEDCVRRVCRALAAISGRSRLLAVDDGSADQTGAILDRLAPCFTNLQVIHHAGNRGYGAALRTGAAAASAAGFDYVVFMDSDLTNDPGDLAKFADKMAGGYDVIKATRYSHGGGVSGVPWYRVAVSVLGNWLARQLLRLPLHDCTNGFRAIRTSLLARMRLTENRFPLIMEELYWSKFMARSYAEVPVTLTDRQHGLRRTSFVYRPKVFYDYLKYPVRGFLRIKPRA